MPLPTDPLTALGLGAGAGAAFGLAGTALACLEVEIEGKHPWARALPVVRRNAPLVCSSGATPLTSYHTALFFATLCLLVGAYVGVSLLTGNPLRAGDVLRVISAQMLLFVTEDSSFFFINPNRVPNHWGGLGAWLARFGISCAVGAALILLGYVADAGVEGGDAEVAAQVGAAAGGGAVLGVLAWIPINWLLTSRLYALRRAFLDPNQKPWYDPSARATDADGVPGALPPPPPLEAAEGVSTSLFAFRDWRGEALAVQGSGDRR